MAWSSRWKWPARLALSAASIGSGAFAAHVTAAVPEPAPLVYESELPPPPVADLVIAEPAPAPVPVEPLVITAEPSEPSYGDGLIIQGHTPHRLVLFTFDDGPDPRYTRRLLDALDRAEIRAVFFLTANRIEGSTPWARENAEIAREIARRGHVIGSHGRNHVALTRVSGEAIAAEVEGADQVFFDVLGLRPRLFRPPGGARSARTDAYLAERGYTSVLWNLGSGDVQVDTADRVVETFRHVVAWRERDSGDFGGVVLLHDIHRWSVEAFPRIVAFFDARNCDLLRRGEELYDFVDDPSLFVVMRPEGASTSEEAPPLVLAPEVLEERQAHARLRAEARCETLASRD